MTNAILGFAISFFAAMVAVASTAKACISCEHVPVVVRGSQTSDPQKHYENRYQKKRVYSATKKREVRPVKKHIVKSKDAEETTETQRATPINVQTENSTITKQVDKTVAKSGISQASRLAQSPLFQAAATIASDKYTEILSPVLAQLLQFDDALDEFRINKQCGPRCIAVFVLDGRRLRDANAHDLPIELRWAKQNFLLIPPNTLLIDEYALLEVVLLSFNDQVALTHFLRMVDQNKGLYDGIDVRTGVVLNRVSNEFIRAENIRYLRKEGSIPEGAAMVRDAWSEKEVGTSGFGASIGFIFLHEFGHHANAKSGFYDASDERIQRFLTNKPFTSTLQKEEAAADAYALERFKAYLRKGVADGVPPLFLLDAAQTPVRNFKAVHYFEMFDGLRGFSYRDLFLTLYHKECEEFTSWVKSGFKEATGREQTVLNDLKYLYHAEERDMVLLTAAEYSVVRTKLLENLAATHPYPASRGRDIYSSISALEEFAEISKSGRALSGELKIVDAIKTGRRSQAGPQLDSGSALKLTVNDVLKGTKADYYTIEKAVNCPIEHCFIIVFTRPEDRNDPFGYLEFAADGEGVKLFKLYARVPTLDLFREGTNYSKKEVKRRLEERVGLLPLISLILKTDKNEDAMSQMSMVVTQRNACGASGKIIELGDRTVGITALAREDWVRIDLL